MENWKRDDQRIFGNVEKCLSEKFNVINVYRDYREDEWDDAGWIASVSEKGGKYYLHILFVSHNLNFESLILDENDMELFKDEKNAYPDFKVFDTLGEVQEELNNWVDIFDSTIGGDDGDPWECLWDEAGDQWDSFIEMIGNPELTELDKDWIRAITNIHYDGLDDIYYQHDREGLLTLTNPETEYVPNFKGRHEDD